ncbi:hypothetical protein CC78DRAFT_457820, partial [Lojkania enalia]
IIAAVVFSTAKTQDMRDQEGYYMRGRKLLPLTIGDRGSNNRLIFILSATLEVRQRARIIFGAFCGEVAVRMVILRSMEANNRIFHIWNAWMALLYTLLLLATVGQNH